MSDLQHKISKDFNLQNKVLSNKAVVFTNLLSLLFAGNAEKSRNNKVERHNCNFILISSILSLDIPS